MQQPVSDMLAGNAQRGAVFHQADIVNVGHFRTADPGVNPANDIAEQALAIVVELLADLVLRPVGAVGQRDGEQLVELCRIGQTLLDLEHVLAVIVDRVQRRRGRARHPGGVGPGAQMADFLDHHLPHQVGRGPHALADLRTARQAMRQSDPDVARFIGPEPGRVLHLALAHHRPRTHRGVNLVTCTVEEAGVDEDDAVLHRVDAGGKIGRSAAFLVHHADLDRVARQTEQVFDRIEQLVGEGAFLGPVHFGLHDIDAAAARIAVHPQPGDILRADGRGDHRVEDTLGDFLAVPAHRRIGHQMADIAHEHQAAPGQAAFAAVLAGIGLVPHKFAGERLAALLEALLQIAADHAEPVAIGGKLVLGIDRRDRILAIGDGGQRGFEIDIGDTQPVGLADLAVRVDHDLDMQAVVPEQRTLVGPPHLLRRIGQLQTVERVEIAPASRSEREDLVEQLARLDDNRGATFLVIATRTSCRRIERVGSVERVVKAAPARVRRIQEEARVEDRHHQLRPRHGRDLGIDILGSDGEITRFGHQVADFLEESAIGIRVVRLSRPLRMPSVDLRLQFFAFSQQRGVARGKRAQQVRETRPEIIGVATQRAEHFGFDEGGKLRIGFDSGARDKFGHGTPRAIVERRCRTRGGVARSMPPAVDLCKARAGLAQRQD